MTLSPFFQLHSDLPREGPGETADVEWTASVAAVAQDARIADLACGPGSDIGDWLRLAPDGHVTGIERQAHFVAAARARYEGDPRVEIRQGDMREPGGPYDLIWCAGAVYFVGVRKALTLWRDALAPGGAVAFSEPCFFVDDPSAEATAFWDGDPVLGTAEDIKAEIAAAGFVFVANRPVGEAAWRNYYRPLDARIEVLAPTADAELAAVLDEARHEHANWEQVRGETGYQLFVVRPA